MRPSLFIALLIVSCGQAEESPRATEAPDAGPVEGDPDPTPIDPTPVDPTPTGDASADTGGGTCTGKIVVNELQPATTGSSNEEFIELYNPSTCDVLLDGFKLLYKSSAGVPANGSPLHAFAAGTTIKGKGYYVVGTTTFKGMKDTIFNGGSVTVNGGLAADGQVALIDGGGQKMDSVGYGTATGDYVEGTAAAKPPVNASVARKSDGLDTDDNSKDCDWLTPPTPGAKNGT